MSLFGQTKRYTPTKPSRRAPLPIFTTDPEKKYGLSSPLAPSSSRWFTMIYVPLPRLPFSRSSSSEALLNGNGHASPSKTHHRTFSASVQRPRKYARICLPIPPRLYAKLPRLNTARRVLLSFLAFGMLVLFLLGFRKRGSGNRTWTPPFVDPDTLVLTPAELAMIWEWEILSGHHPSIAPPPDNIPLPSYINNPAVPPSLLPMLDSSIPLVAYNQRTTGNPKTQLIGTGPERKFVSISDVSEAQPGYPPRPLPGAILDLDLVNERCDFNTNKHVRDCLEFLRVGANLDNGNRVRRGNYLGPYKQVFFEGTKGEQKLEWTPRNPSPRQVDSPRTPLTLAAPQTVPATYNSQHPCDPEHPRIFHIFWTGPFTDKPYMAVMSFLFTQNLGLDKTLSQTSDDVRGTCRPQFWVWINPGPAAAVPKPNAKLEMYEALATNPWASPFLHERFRDVVKFKMWNTTEQLDGIDELRDHWRTMPIFNSGGNTYRAPAPQQTTEAQQQETAESTESTESGEPPKNLGELIAEGAEEQAEKESLEAAAAKEKDKKKKQTIFDKIGTESESDYDRLSVTLSDMVRFILTHRFGGIYLDADTIFLQDWETLWNWRGQFAYRWSWHSKYNTAVLKLHKGSALGTFLFKTALANGLDFHPMTVSRYLKDAQMEKLLFRLPDALFDGAWLNMEGYQRDRPPFPYFRDFSIFFSNDKSDTAAPQAVGWEGFFRGSFSYHFHNFWWRPMDPTRNFPDLGQRFAKGETTLRDAARLSKLSPEGAPRAPVDLVDGVTSREDMDDEVDLSWSTVLKRTFEAYLRGERPNAYGEHLNWEDL